MTKILLFLLIFLLLRTVARAIKSQHKETEGQHPRQELIELYFRQAQGVSTGELERRLAEARNQLTSFEYSILLLRLSAALHELPPQDLPK